MYNSGLGYIGDAGDETGYVAPPPTTAASNPWIYETGSTDWADFALGTMKLLPNIFSSFKGNPYGQSPGTQGQQGGGSAAGFNLQGSSLLGGGSVGISNTTLLLLGAVALMFFMKK